MYRKQCTVCNEISYSATDVGEWRCPRCGADLSSLEADTNMEKEIERPDLEAAGEGNAFGSNRFTREG